MHVCTYICIYVYIYMSVRSPSPNTAFFLASGGRVCRASTSPPWKDPTRLSCQGGLVDPDSLDYLMRDNISCLVMVSARTTPRMPRPPRPSRRIGRGGGAVLGQRPAVRQPGPRGAGSDPVTRQHPATSTEGGGRWSPWPRFMCRGNS